MGYKPFTAIPPAIRWDRKKEDRARHHHIVYMKQTGFKDIKVSPSGPTLMSTHSFIGASGDEWIHEPRDLGAKKGVLEIKSPFSTNNCLMHCMAPKQIAMECPSTGRLQQMMTVLDDGKYSTVKRDPTVKAENSITNILKSVHNEGHIDDKQGAPDTR